jgi:hypothetical protein
MPHKEWLASGHTDSTSDLRAVHFDGEPQLAWEGFAHKWSQYRLLSASTPTMRSHLDQVIADSRRAIAAQQESLTAPVTISIAY